MPNRLQRSRARGWRMPAGAIYVGRPGPFGNPFPVAGEFIMWAAVARGRVNCDRARRETAVEFYRAWLLQEQLPAVPPAEGDDLVEYESGLALSTAELARGQAAEFAWVNRAEIAVRRPPRPAEIARLAGRDLVCWCALCARHREGKALGIVCADCAPCHVDPLLALANPGG